jgi:putative addiction module CopG family antidote
MRSTKQFSITLSNDLAEVVRAKVASGEYATESEVIRDGLRAMQARDRIVEQWLQSQAVPSYDAVKADPSCAVPIKKVRANLVKAHRRAAKKTSG